MKLAWVTVTQKPRSAQRRSPVAASGCAHAPESRTPQSDAAEEPACSSNGREEFSSVTYLIARCSPPKRVTVKEGDGEVEAGTRFVVAGWARRRAAREVSQGSQDGPAFLQPRRPRRTSAPIAAR
jgi:hypothetical protein